jgi:hypothetical protein
MTMVKQKQDALDDLLIKLDVPKSKLQESKKFLRASLQALLEGVEDPEEIAAAKSKGLGFLL